MTTPNAREAAARSIKNAFGTTEKKDPKWKYILDLVTPTTPPEDDDLGTRIGKQVKHFSTK